MRAFALLRSVLIGSLLLLINTVAGAADQITVVMNTADDSHIEAFAALKAHLQTSLPEARITEVDAAALDDNRLASSEVVISLGSLSARSIAQRKLTQMVIYSLLPESTWRQLPPRPRGSAGSAIILDQPAERQIALLKLALPDWKRIALLSSPDADPRQRQLIAAAKAAHFEVREVEVSAERELYEALQRVLLDPAILIATPDTRIFNSLTVQNVLLTAYRHRSPILGFSASYVRAGALLGLYSTPTQIGHQTAEMILRLIQGAPLPVMQAPQQFEVAINLNVARSLGIELDTADVLTAALLQREKGRK